MEKQMDGSLSLCNEYKKYFPIDEQGNVTKGAVEIQNSFNNLAFNYLNSRTIVLNDVNELLVVNTENGILICPQQLSIRASEIVPHLEDGAKEILIDCENIKIENQTETPIACIGCKGLKIECDENKVSVETK